MCTVGVEKVNNNIMEGVQCLNILLLATNLYAYFPINLKVQRIKYNRLRNPAVSLNIIISVFETQKGAYFFRISRLMHFSQ